MNSIIGIIKPYRLIVLLFALALSVSCKHGAKDDDDGGDTAGTKTIGRIEVKVTNPRVGTISESISMNATTVFLLNDVVRAPIAGYITKINVTPGQSIKQGDVLFSVQSKEAAAIPGDSLFPSKGTILVKATESGIVKSVDRQQGDYMQDGDPLCTIANSSSLVFMMDVPFESRRFIKSGSNCIIALPDGETMSAHIASQIPEMDKSVQMERYVLRASASLTLPEGLIASVRIPTATKANAIILPKTAVLSDETQTEFWVMKLVHDTLAIK
ncbi:MAG TPA: HlyD family efflux transporter periplasmic adaptor subunit, partial [Bacteroidia bacterium]|nr:HlyD family efflux transporter periplasmic adaptor subunit [Bacteroidia bacterium]